MDMRAAIEFQGKPFLIKQLRLVLAHSRVAQSHRKAATSVGGL
jgi:hypothetical protein